MIGQTVSHYRVIEKLGGGGMGVVYRAEDLRLKRPVAIKVLPPELTRDEESKQRFVLEAQAASALDHPNICTIFEIDETPDGQLFLVMAYYAGETLKKRIEHGPLPIDIALDYAVQIAQGLVKAHAAGIVHRDIKPANILLSADGLAKVVDFGVAKLLGATGMTRIGTALGTVAYMAPEQTMGHDVDARTDVWALGVVLYEMIAGQLPFKGEHDLAIAGAVVNTAPTPLTSVRSGIPLELERIVNRALAKAPGDRYQTAADFLSELRQLRRATDPQMSAQTITQTGAGPTRRRLSAVGVGAGVLIAIVAAAGTLRLAWRGAESATPAIPQLTNARQVAGTIDFEALPSWSPDGSMLAYQAGRVGLEVDIWIAQVGGGLPVNRTPDNPGMLDLDPRWSPDGRQIAFWSLRGDGGVYVMPALAGQARRIATTYESIPAWSPDGSELAYAVADRDEVWLEIQKLSDGTTRRVLLPGRRGNQRLDPMWSPDGRFIAYADARNHTSQVTQLSVLRLSDGHAVPISDGRMMEWTSGWSPDSRTLYFTSNRGGTQDLWQLRIGDDGSPVSAAQQISSGLGVITAAISPDGRHVAYDKGRGTGNAWRVPILPDRGATWADAEQLTFDAAYVEFLDVSPDGNRLAISSDRRGNPDIWTLPAEGGDLQQLTSDPTPDWAPAWSPDGREIVFYAYRSGNREIWVQPVAGGPARQLTNGDAESVFPRWSADGKSIVYSSRVGSGVPDLSVVAASGGQPRRLAERASNPEWSRDGQWIFFRGNRNGQTRTWRIPAAGGPEQLVFSDGTPIVSGPDGKWLYCIRFQAQDRNIWTISADGKASRPLTAFAGKHGRLATNALSTDGRYLYFTWEEGASDIWVMDLSPAR